MPPRKKHKEKLPVEALRSATSVVRAESEDTLKQVLQLVKETDARSRVLFTKVHNLIVDVGELTRKYDAILGCLKELFDRPDQLTHAEHIIKDFLREKYKV